MRRFAILLVLSAGVAIAAEKPEQKAPSAEGTWLVTSIEIGGVKVVNEEALKMTPFKIVITGDKWKLTAGDEVSSGTTKIDPTKKPAEIDVTTTEGPQKGSTMKGIVELKGDTMRACYDPEGKERPKEFSTKDKPTYILIEYKREKK